MSKIKGYKLFCEAQMWSSRIKDIKNYMENTDMIEDIWLGMTDYIYDKVKVEFIQIDEKDSVINKDFQIPKVVIEFYLDLSNTNIDGGRSTHKIEDLKDNECYDDLLHTNGMMMNALGSKKYDITASIDPHHGGRMAIHIEYELTEAFLKSIVDRMKYSTSDAGRYHRLIKDREDIKDIPVVKSIKKIADAEKVQDDFKDIYRDLLNYGFKFEHIIDKARELDFGKCIDSGCHSPDLFFVMCMTGEYDEMESLRDFRPDYFFYKSSHIDSSLGYDLLFPAFKHCMRTELLWVEGENEERELSLLFLLMKPDLLKSHMEDGDDRDKWIEMLRSSFNHVAENLIALNRKESLQWLIDLIKSRAVDRDSKRAVEEFIIDYNLHLRRIKSDFSGKVKWHEVTPVQKGKFSEAPDFEFFNQKLVELKEYVT